ncbi:multiple monosaccharide ABC transporter substrate-binding protein [Rhodoferax sp.]|uniref:multiple monosaccharide ABC transporter substrate-binding protein n=1 Tax=Rhodoferax sp. TaxID=50421 RepID=UPI0025EE67B3|nr:multiple monosaccharide ABC transporter substrate-binding protein [Rhodoferax sp.]
MQSDRRRLVGGLVGSLFALTAWSQAGNKNEKGVIGISLPTITSLRWVIEGLAMTRSLDKLGYRAILQYANDDIPTQTTQIEAMLAQGATVLVISAIDGTQLAPVLKAAADKGVKVIAYDRLIRGSPHVDYYTTFDNFQVGVLQGSDIANRLGLAAGKGPLRIELFAGSPDDNNAHFFYNGAMSVLKPYLDKGQLVVGSGQIGMDKVSTLRWSGSVARARLAGILDKYYAKQHLDAVLSPYDGISMDLIEALKKAGYSQSGQGGQPLPIVTGQDAELPSVRSIVRGEQTSTVFKDNRDLAQVTATMVDALLNGKKPTTNDEKTYNNGEKVVPAFLLKPVLVDVKNWRATLVDSGFYKAEQFR